MKTTVSIFLATLSLLFWSGCSTQVISTSQSTLPDTYIEAENAEDAPRITAISVFRFNNYTDTPRAGMRAANIFSGLLASYGYKTINHIDAKTYSFEDAQRIASEDDADYFVYGGVSEWRYKTGIDGEPAVSVQLNLYKTSNGEMIWSATGSDSDWGNGSIGTTAQDLFETILTVE